MRRVNIAVLFVLVLAALPACSEAAPKSVKEPKGPQFSVRSVDGRFALAVDTTPRPLPTNEHFSMTIDVTTNDPSVDLSVIDIEVDADMPEHKHGMNTLPIVKRTSPERFTVEGMLFHMPGNWEIYVILKDDKNWTERLVLRHVAG